MNDLLLEQLRERYRQLHARNSCTGGWPHLESYGPVVAMLNHKLAMESELPLYPPVLFHAKPNKKYYPPVPKKTKGKAGRKSC
jgi:hypothetical protein